MRSKPAFVRSEILIRSCFASAAIMLIMASAKNHAARIAKGEYIVFNDSDDLFYPDAVMRLYDALPGSGHACSYGTYQTIDPDGKELPTKRKMKFYPSGKIIEYLLCHVIVNSCGTLIPRQLFLESGGFDTSLRVMHDYNLFLELSLKCEFYAVQNPVFGRRRHGSNLSSANYAKMQIANSVFENFVAKHPELRQCFPRIIRKRCADMQNRLYREAQRENMKKEAAIHARKFFRLTPGIKSFCRMVFSALTAK
ncbi:MAG: glycosyltransferase [Lentisphaeria bacterium]|nr:glycosyltransferase [Lentisphaeria bacterium]